MADRPSGDQEPGDLEGQHTLADREQTLADRDQTASDRDQGDADSDQAAADSDQAASDRDLAAGGDPGEHERSREARDVNAQRRGEAGRRRVSGAAARDDVADARDQAALARDRAASLRDAELAARDAELAAIDGRALTLAEVLARAAEYRSQAAVYRAAAAEARVQAATDREQAARDRAQADADRKALMQKLLLAETDPLTGARARGAGLADLDREINRTRRATGRLVVAYVDVVGLKAVNDLSGHAAGDRLLQRAVRTIREQLRSYDLIVRVGGDEFVCVLSGASLEEAGERFASVRRALAAEPEPCEIRVGFADLAPDDSAAALIERADGDLPTGGRR